MASIRVTPLGGVHSVVPELLLGELVLCVTNLPVGHYALRPTFSDGHESGIYSWDYLYDLGLRQDELWQRYIERLAKAGASREPA